MNLPDKQLLRRGEVMAWLGLRKDAFSKLLKAEALTVVRVDGKGRAFFRRTEVLRLGESTRLDLAAGGKHGTNGNEGTGNKHGAHGVARPTKGIL